MAISETGRVIKEKHESLWKQLQYEGKHEFSNWFSGLPFELSVFWQQYPWQWGLGICKLRAYVSETWVDIAPVKE